tara:strand:+ start:90 stop:527 length:438 start_codon:yes stop_codon:yes gene_type:complete
MQNNLKRKIGIVSGYFNPLHRGHLEYINKARSEVDKLIAIVNNDLQVKLKQSKFFLDQDHRKLIIENLKAVNYALISIDIGPTVSRTIEYISKNIHGHLIYFNSGDSKTPNPVELHTCEKYSINYKFIPLPKLTSSSKILKKLYL